MTTIESTLRTDTARNYIGGCWVPSSTTGTSYSPATGEPLGTYYEADSEQVREAIRIAKDTFATHVWRRDRHLRAKVLEEMADRIEAASGELAMLLARENGKILPEADFELSLTPSKLRYYAAQALTDTGRGGRVRDGVYSMLLSEPIGVAGVIVPWNSPVVLAVRSFAPALAAGCTVVMKMAAQTALVNARLAELLADCPSLPAGVLNIFTESGSDGAKLLVSSPDVNAVSYTGSTAVGRQIMAAGGATLKRLSLELGGKTPMIVFDDADLDAAVGTIVAGIATFTGQFCMTGSRILVQRSIADRVREALVQALEQVKVGPGDQDTSHMGPMIDIVARDRLEALLAEHSRDADVIVRGGRPDDPALSRGAYFRPALLAVDDVASPLVQRELFGPVATFEIFDTEDDAVRMGNATEYGLAASVWTRDGARGLRMADALDAGTVWTNGWAVVVDQFEEGGYKQSGLGRLNGHRALEEFQEYKHVVQVI
ncbi:aldehyde dehydrogenase family protein [Prescottella agglutinans]|uniref:Betaine-aldehyde dehydrogenase n=1 Tax=Prescottella agglutinans TaxID=1644129 RepID=A0ABT6MIG7_9NOCA|nr:aldehyde dehydrogenase family protein [Prescottella agglutinans]MDH6284092.1 betaine-aldehyde dehydrogenase [Prescottella agglutinans]